MASGKAVAGRKAVTGRKTVAGKKAAAGKAAAGQAQFVIDAEEETLDVFLDRQGFRRLLETLEKLAQSGEDQMFEKSGQQIGQKGTRRPDTIAIGKLVFRINGSENDQD